MDPHSEVEAKFEADGLKVSQIQDWLDLSAADQILGPSGGPVAPNFDATDYHRIMGTDTFMTIGRKTLRIRDDRDMETGKNQVCLTVKERKSKASMLDRKEIDLYVNSVDGSDAQAFFKMLNATEEFVLGKSYYVWKIQYGPYDVCLAMYDVGRVARGGYFGWLADIEVRRFLEVEIDRHSKCSEQEGLAELDRWVAVLQNKFSLEAPVNYSLYEKYKP